MSERGDMIKAIAERHMEFQRFLDRLPESSRILYAAQIAMHEDRAALIQQVRSFANVLVWG